MKATLAQIERAVASPPAGIRLFLFYGPDEAGSRALAKRFERSLGSDVERIDLEGATLKTDPARLSDEAASFSLFGAKRMIRLLLAGEEALAAIEALLSSTTSGSPVIAIAGALKPTSSTLKLILANKSSLGFASYPLEDDKAEELALALGREAGLRLSPEAARRIVTIAANDRAIIASEIEKLSLYLDAAPERPTDADIDALADITAGIGDGRLSKLVDAVFDGHPILVSASVNALAQDGINSIALIRAMTRRTHLLMRLRAEVENGTRATVVIERAGRAIYGTEKDAVPRQLNRWSAQRIGIVAKRLLDAECAIKAAGSAGPILAERELIAICRAAGKR